MLNELFHTAAESLLDLCGEDATLKTGDSTQNVRAVSLSLIKQKRDDANGSTAQSGRTILIRSQGSVQFLPGKSRIELQTGTALVISSAALPGGELYQLEIEDVQ